MRGFWFIIPQKFQVISWGDSPTDVDFICSLDELDLPDKFYVETFQATLGPG